MQVLIDFFFSWELSFTHLRSSAHRSGQKPDWPWRWRRRTRTSTICCGDERGVREWEWRKRRRRGREMEGKGNKKKMKRRKEKEKHTPRWHPRSLHCQRQLVRPPAPRASVSGACRSGAESEGGKEQKGKWCQTLKWHCSFSCVRKRRWKEKKKEGKKKGKKRKGNNKKDE